MYNGDFLNVFAQITQPQVDNVCLDKFLSGQSSEFLIFHPLRLKTLFYDASLSYKSPRNLRDVSR